MRLRLALTTVAASALIVGLSACEKPAPGATAFSGTTSQSSEATCWGKDGASIDVDQCAQAVMAGVQAGDAVPSIPVVPGETIGISVDQVVADAGWQPIINNQSRAAAPITSTYYRFTFPELAEVPAEGVMMQIIAGDSGNLRGVWLFRLVPAS